YQPARLGRHWFLDGGPQSGPNGAGVLAAPLTTPFAPLSGPNSTYITVVMNQTNAASPFTANTAWRYTATIIPNAVPGKIDKLGSQRLNIQGPGIYTGGVDIGEGVVRVQNNTALGVAGNLGTVVEAGGALELDTTAPDQNGGLAVGPSIWNTPLT